MKFWKPIDQWQDVPEDTYVLLHNVDGVEPQMAIAQYIVDTTTLDDICVLYAILSGHQYCAGDWADITHFAVMPPTETLKLQKETTT